MHATSLRGPLCRDDKLPTVSGEDAIQTVHAFSIQLPYESVSGGRCPQSVPKHNRRTIRFAVCFSVVTTAHQRGLREGLNRMLLLSAIMGCLRRVVCC